MGIKAIGGDVVVRVLYARFYFCARFKYELFEDVFVVKFCFEYEFGYEFVYYVNFVVCGFIVNDYEGCYFI